jgi:hypothetical protein
MNIIQQPIPKPVELQHQQDSQNEDFKKHLQDSNDPQHRRNYPQNRRWTDKVQNEAPPR